MTEQTKNSAEALIELRAALHKLDQSLTSGVNKESVGLALHVQRLSMTLLETVTDERCIQIGGDLILKNARISA
jgi:hypothetical protein